MGVIKTEGLTKYYGKSRGIVDLKLNVNEKEIFGFIGPNGAGKSTTIRTLLGLIAPTSGKAEILGHDIVKDHTKILEKVGYMLSEAVFYRGMKVKEVIKFSAELHKKDCSKEAEQLCERLQLDTGKKVEELSLGNRKKVSIVCAMQHKPELYILDEPTSGLDPLMQKEFFSLLEERNKQGAAIFLSSHVLSEIQNHCHRAAIIRDGRIIACDSVAALSKTTARRVTLTGVEVPPSIPGIKDIHKDEGYVSFLYQGNLKALISELNNMDMSDLTITEPSLEEIFLHFYKEGESRE